MQLQPNSKSSPGQMVHAGGVALSILAVPLNVDILRSLEQEPKCLLDLRMAVGSPPQSTMRVYSRMLSEQGIVKHPRETKSPRSAKYELTRAGRDLLRVASVLEQWLGMAPRGPIRLGTTASKSTTKALVEGWSTNIVRAIAPRRLSLTELNEAIPQISYPALERRLGSMRLAGLVAVRPDDRRGTPYAPTDWLRRSIVPVGAAAAWERRHRPVDAQPIGRLGVEAAFLLAIPLLRMPSEFSGKCRLAVELQEGGPSFAGVRVCIEAGAVVSCSTCLDGQVEAWATGSVDLWIERVSQGENHPLEQGGDTSMAGAILNGLVSAVTLSPPLDTDEA
jgi:DNA-binding HxlR family transcriptional regulator